MKGLQRSSQTQAIVDLEDSGLPSLSERLPGSLVPFWLQVRMQFPSLMREDESIPVSVPSANALWRLGRSILPDRTDLARWRTRRDIVFLVGGNTMHERSGRARNWLVGSYVEALAEQSVIVQRGALSSALGDPAFAATRSLDPLLARAELRVALRRRTPSAVDRRVEELIREFASHLGVEDHPRLPDVIASAAWTERVRPHIERSFDRFLDRARPHTLIFEDASYGSYYASLIARARARGVSVAEPQHGWIGPTHAAYNYGASMHLPENAIGLPDSLLTFGEQWGQGLSYPGVIVPVGKPHLEERAAAALSQVTRRDEVLVISSVADVAETITFIRELESLLPSGWTVRFRPHPSERAVLASRYPGLLDIPRVSIDDEPDVYDSLAECRVVVGATSTVLFEATALGCRVFIRESPTGPYVVGEILGAPLAGDVAVARVLRHIADDAEAGAVPPQVDVDSLWRPHAVSNFVRWVQEERG